MNFTFVPILILLFFAIELVYFKIASYFNIIDKPNLRSSHTDITIRGGGVIFAISLFLYPLFGNFEQRWFLLGLFLIGTVSFWDDIKQLNTITRLSVQLIAVTLLFYQLNLFVFSLYLLLVAVIATIGIINIVNFMDGINGLTGLYGLTALSTLLFINRDIHFTDSKFLFTVIIALIVFLFFNFRIKAICFAGDVGSVSIAFIIVFFLFQLILKTHNPAYILCLLIYWVDGLSTITFRILRSENIFKAHRSHFYQYLSNEKKVPQLVVSSVYGLAQLIVNVVVLLFKPSLICVLLIAAISFSLFILIRFLTEGYQKLVVVNNCSINK